ncbi:hypothetical protein B0H13DRAFT_2576320 [Mycena leptocephala]|nr:hypothetical protein B0H13DRAFT_2576320 [Mycena leptocephala]
MISALQTGCDTNFSRVNARWRKESHLESGMGCPCSVNGLHHKVLWRRLALRIRVPIHDHYYINIKVKYKEIKYKDREYKSKNTAAGQPHRERRFGFCAPYAEQVEIYADVYTVYKDIEDQWESGFPRSMRKQDQATGAACSDEYEPGTRLYPLMFNEERGYLPKVVNDPFENRLAFHIWGILFPALWPVLLLLLLLLLNINYAWAHHKYDYAPKLIFDATISGTRASLKISYSANRPQSGALGRKQSTTSRFSTQPEVSGGGVAFG